MLNLDKEDNKFIIDADCPADRETMSGIMKSPHEFVEEWFSV